MASEWRSAVSSRGCKLCGLRVESCRDHGRYVAASSSLKEGGSTQDSGACGLCLGLLERGPSLQAALAGKLTEAPKVEASYYKLNVSVPAACVLREQILLSYARSSSEGGTEQDIVPVEDVLRWLLEEELGSAGLSPAAGVAEEPSLQAVISISVSGEYAGPASNDLECLASSSGARAGPKGFKKRRRGQEEPPQEAPAQVTAKAVLQVLRGLDAEACARALGSDAARPREELLERLARVEHKSATASVEIGRDSFYLTGRYLKFSRRLPQSLWLIDGERKGDSSVEEQIAGPLAKLFCSPEVRFHAEGREDIDVRMLGAGRPFVVEVRNARLVSPTPAMAEAAVNAGAGQVLMKGDLLQVRKLLPCKASDMTALQRDAESHRKTYICVCWCERPLLPSDVGTLAAKGTFQVNQKTPVRVLHRRAAATRPKTVHWLDAEVLDPHYFKLRVCAEAGMYIKEFVHGDFGRTRPSMRSLLGGQVEILQLDVEGLEDGE